MLFVSVLDKLGIAEEVNKKSKLVTGMHNSELVAKGEVELAVQASHEILAVPRYPIHLDAVRVSKRPRVFSCSIREPKGARCSQALVDFLSSLAKGMQPG